MLREEVAKYSELSGNDGQHTPIGVIGAYLDGYDKGLSTEKWIPITTRIDERGEEILDCPLPDDCQEVLISYSGNVYIDTFWNDDLNYFEDFDIGDVDAWQPLPEPYKKGASK